jgi:hypothetical protein
MDGGGPFATKLSCFISLSDEDVRFLDALCIDEERFEADADIVRQGDVPRSAFVLTRGMAFRYRLMPDGKRQILTFMIPGDVFGLHAFLLRTMDHSIATLVCRRGSPRSPVPRCSTYSSITHELAPRCGGARCRRRRSTASASSRLDGAAHAGASPICCASWCGGRRRLGWPRITQSGCRSRSSSSPMRLGLTSVHINRILQGFRRDNLIALAQHRLTLLDVERQQKIAAFNQDYLHLGGATTEVRSYFDTLDRNRRHGC